MDPELIVREMGGGLAAVLVSMLLSAIVFLAAICRALNARNIALQDKMFDLQQNAAREARETQGQTLTALSANTAALTTATAAMTAAVAEIRRAAP